jgi:PAS domain S-box-containing protein
MPAASVIKVLLTEDNPGDYLLVQEYLSGTAQTFAISRAVKLSEAIELLQQDQFDVILLDLSLPDSHGLDSVRIIHAYSDKVPVIVLTGFGNEQYGVESVKMGAEDYLVKDDINSSLLVKVILYSIERARLRKEMDRQDRLFRVISENSLDGKVLIDPAGNILYCTPSIKAVLGFENTECVGKNEKDFVHPDDIGLFFSYVGQVIENPEDQPTFEVRVMHGDGYYRWCEKTILNLLHDEYVKGIVCTFRDVTERKNAAEQIASNERRLSSLVQSGSDLIGILDREGNYSYVSPTSTRVLGLTPEFFIGKNAFDFIHPEDLQRTLEEFGQMQTKSAIKVGPFRFQDAWGQWRWIESEVTNLLGDPAVNGIVANSRDITEKLVAERELRRLSLIARETINAVIITNPEGVISWVNDSFTTITGYTFEEVINKKPGALLQGPETDLTTVRFMREMIRAQKPFEVEIINYSKDGRKYWIQIQCQPIFDAAGVLQNFFAIETDVTERKQNEELLKASEERYRSLFDLSPASILIWDPETLQIIEVNETAEKEYGYSKEEFKRMTVLDYRNPDDFAAIKELAESFVKQERIYFRGIWNHRNKRGELMKMDFVKNLIWYQGRRVVLSHGQNITERLRLEETLEDERRIQQLRITDAVISAQEKEREEIGRELHDNVNQILASSRLYLGLVKKGDAQTDHYKFLAETDKLINHAIQEIRNLSHALIPSAIYETPLAEQLDTLIRNISPAAKLTVLKQYKELNDDELSGKLKLSVYRIVQEQLNNILKYAKAKTVFLHLSLRDGCLLLSVKDDGIGFDTSQKKDGVGLVNIRTRAALFNGQVDVISSPGHGCELRVILNLD